MLRILPALILRFVASIFAIAILTAHPTVAAQQKPAAPLNSQGLLVEDRVKQLESRLNEAEQKAAGAAMEKDYITRIQKQYETYYEKVLSTQMWTLGLMGLILTAVFGLAAKFSLDIFDSRTKSALDAALAQVEKKFGEQMQKELESLRQQNAAQLTALEDAFTKRIAQQEEDLKARSTFQFRFAQALTVASDQRYADARTLNRGALRIYKSGKARQLIPKRSGALAARNLFRQFKKEDAVKFMEKAERELADELYNDLEDELARAAVKLEWLAPLLAERKRAPSLADAAAELPAVPNDDE